MSEIVQEGDTETEERREEGKEGEKKEGGRRLCIKSVTAQSCEILETLRAVLRPSPGHALICFPAFLSGQLFLDFSFLMDV